MCSSGSLWLHSWLADHPPGYTAVPNQGALGKQEEGTAAASLFYIWQKCQHMGGGPETGGTCVAHYVPL